MPNRDLPELLQQLILPEAGSAAVLLAARDGTVTSRAALGTTRRWDAPGVPTVSPVAAVEISTRFDLASITKTFVAAALLAELDVHGLDPTLALADVLPEFRAPGRDRVTAAHLLSHTAGFAAEWHDRDPDPGARRFRAGAHPLDPAGAVHRYSCVGLIWAGILASELSGAPLDALVERRVLHPLGLKSTGYLPAATERRFIAATEFQPGRGMVQGEVHDETAFALGGVSGNAGIFGTAPDLLRFAEELRSGGGTGLSPRVVRWLTEPLAPELEQGSASAETGLGYRPTLGLRSGEDWAAAAPGRAVGHTGFTGTLFLTEPAGSWSLVLLTNRVHPSRTQETMLRLRASIVAGVIASERG